MQKRLGIARALIVKPEVILYDEPTAGLDPVTSRTIAELILNLRRESGNTALTVTNDVQRAYQLGDRIYFLAQGRLIEGGTPAQVRKTQEPALRQFIQGLREGPLASELV
jgi:phospholipid/cholesterol/gamma-HCH transport system ATP-binding protein